MGGFDMVKKTGDNCLRDGRTPVNGYRCARSLKQALFVVFLVLFFFIIIVIEVELFQKVLKNRKPVFTGV
jgi:hypothetical protein